MWSFVGRGGLWVVGQVLLLGLYVVALWETTTLAPALRMLGALLAAAGLFLFAGGVGALGTHLTPYPEPTRHGRLVRSGVYGMVRHPIYGGSAIAAIGLALVVASWWAVVVGAVLLVYFRLKAGAEEHRLLAVYPDYARYRSEVRAMLVPFIL
jgi:protein-S-isoprenylcysteine O-methyltransferase Ste14